jgi:hypothetical protein
MLYLIRRQFPDRVMDHNDLDGVAALLRGWYRDQRHDHHDDVYQYLELRLWGFARQRGEALLGLLQEGLKSYGLPASYAQLSDPDTIVVQSPPVPLLELLPPGLWLDLFGDEQFSGLPIMVRLSIGEGGGQTQPIAEQCTTLILVGAIQKGQLLLKAIWPNRMQSTGHEQLFHNAVWPEESQFLKALDGFRKTGNKGVPTPSLFLSPAQVQLGTWVIRLLYDLPGQARLPAFLGRLGFFLTLMAMAGLLLLVPLWWVRRGPVIWFGLIGLTGFFFNLWRKARHIYQFHSRMKVALRKLYSEPNRLLPVSLEELGVASNPASLKYSSELEALSARRIMDVQLPNPSSRSISRVFQMPGDHTVNLLNIMLATKSLSFFPAQPFLFATTYFTDGSRLVSNNTKHSGFQKPRKPNVTFCCFAKATYPGDFIDNYRKVLKRLLEEGKRLAPPLSPQGILDAHMKEHEESASLAKKQGYITWGAAIRQSFGILRKEYITDAD